MDSNDLSGYFLDVSLDSPDDDLVAASLKFLREYGPYEAYVFFGLTLSIADADLAERMNNIFEQADLRYRADKAAELIGWEPVYG